MSKSNSPSLLSPGDRMAEIGSLIATGYRRLRLLREKGLDVSADVERSCDSVNGTSPKETKEVA